MRAPLFTFSMNEKARGSALHFLNEGNCKFVSTLLFLNEGVDDRGPALHFLNEGKVEGFCSLVPR